MIAHTPRLYTPSHARIDADAAFAYRTFCRQVWLLSRNAPEPIPTLGHAATRAYVRALRAAGGSPSDLAWRDFVRAVWALVHELDRHPSQAFWRWRDAYGALGRILFDNVDLLEAQPEVRRKHDRFAVSG